MSSALFTPYRTTGVVVSAGAEQLALQPLGTATFLTAPSGRGFQVFDVANMLMSPVVCNNPLPVFEIGRFSSPFGPKVQL